MAESVGYPELLERSQYLHTLLTNDGSKLTEEHIKIDSKVFSDFIDKVTKQLKGNEDKTDLNLWSLEVKASTGGGEPLSNNRTHIDPHTGKMLFNSLHYFPLNQPPTNYSAVWVFTTTTGGGGGDILRPYIMPGLKTTDPGATIFLHKNGPIWNVKFQATTPTHTVYSTDKIGSYVGLYVVIDSEDIYLMPHTTVGGTELDIIGTKKSYYDVYVWEMVKVGRNYVLPVPAAAADCTDSHVSHSHRSRNNPCELL